MGTKISLMILVIAFACPINVESHINPPPRQKDKLDAVENIWMFLMSKDVMSPGRV